MNQTADVIILERQKLQRLVGIVAGVSFFAGACYGIAVMVESRKQQRRREIDFERQVRRELDLSRQAHFAQVIDVTPHP